MKWGKTVFTRGALASTPPSGPTLEMNYLGLNWNSCLLSRLSTAAHQIPLILDGNSERCAHLRSNLCFLIWHLIRSRAFTNRIYFLRKRLFLFHASATCFELLSNLSTMIPEELAKKIKRERHTFVFLIERRPLMWGNQDIRLFILIGMTVHTLDK